MPDQLLPSGTAIDSADTSTDPFDCVQWELEWSTRGQPVPVQAISLVNYNISLILRCIPKLEFADKICDMWLAIGLILYSGEPDDGKIVYEVPLSKVQPIQLTKEAQYQCMLIHSPGTPPTFTDPILAAIGNNSYKRSAYPHSIGLNKFGSYISTKVTIANMGCPLSDSLRKFNDFGAFLSAESKNKFSDVTLVASQKHNTKGDGSSVSFEFSAHKVILAARSPVFASMFEQNMQESSNNKVEIDDVCPDALKEMLTYIYTGQISDVGNVAYDLLYAADKYQLDDLKSFCEQQLSKSLKVENAARMVQFAHMHNTPILKRRTLRFIASHGAEVRATTEWEEVKQHADILDELLQVIYEPVSKKAKKV